MGRVIANKHCGDSRGRSLQYDLSLHILGIMKAHLVLKTASVPLLPALYIGDSTRTYIPWSLLTFDTLTGSFVGKRPRDAIIVSHNQQL